jgi:hypothetical protein
MICNTGMRYSVELHFFSRPERCVDLYTDHCQTLIYVDSKQDFLLNFDFTRACIPLV